MQSSRGGQSSRAGQGSRGGSRQGSRGSSRQGSRAGKGMRSMRSGKMGRESQAAGRSDWDELSVNE
jgi:hypothetical protein